MKYRHILKLLRPVQWLKNLMLLFPPFLGGVIFQPDRLSMIYIPVISFCLASSAIYTFNDLADASVDKLHPEKKFRPLPSGEVSTSQALCLAGLLLVMSVPLAAVVSIKFLLLLLAYLAVSLLYSLYFKDYPLLDIFFIASGFILRLLAGGVAFKVIITEWLFLSVFLLALFLSIGKRCGEMRLLGALAGNHRKSLSAYPEGFLDGLLCMTGSAVLVTYTMYVLSKNSSVLLYSVPLCCFGLMRYMLRVQSGKGGDPTESLTRDIPLLIVGLSWAVLVGWGVYG